MYHITERFLYCFQISKFYPGMWKKRKLEAVKFLWKRKNFVERSWKRTRKQLTFWGAGSESIFH